MKNPNENCLAGMKCPNPECTHPYGPFEIAAQTTFTVYDDGTDEHTDVEWDDKSWAMCLHCHTETTVGGLKRAGNGES